MARLTADIADHLYHFIETRCKKYSVTKTAFLSDLIEAFCVEETEWMAEGSRWERKKAAADTIMRKYSEKQLAVESMKVRYKAANSQLSLFQGSGTKRW